MVNYSNGKIYKIEPTVEYEEGDIYIGSTTKLYLSQRMDTHRSNFKLWKNNKYRKVQIFEIFEKYGVSNCHIVLLETVNANIKEELLAREKYYIKSIKCVNKHNPLRTIEEKRIQRNEIIKKFYLKYPEKLAEYIEKVKERITCCCGIEISKSNKAHHEKSINHQNFINNIATVVVDRKEKQKLYREANKERLSEKTNCPCSGCYRLGDKSTHFKSIKHQNYLKSLKNIETSNKT